MLEDVGKPIEAFDPTDPGMAGLLDAALGGWFRNETGELFEGFPITADDVVLDVGCGDGGNIFFSGQQGAHVAMVDIDPGKVAEAERRARQSRARAVTALVSDCNPVPLPDGFASVVICTEVLEHVPDPDKFMAELVRLGRPGARYLISVPDGVMERVQLPLAVPGYFAAPNHIRIFDRDELMRLALRHGLLIERTQTYGFFWALWWTMFWACDVQLGERHPVLDHWGLAWAALLRTQHGPKIQRELDKFAPKSQLVLARKLG